MEAVRMSAAAFEASRRTLTSVEQSYMFGLIKQLNRGTSGSGMDLDRLEHQQIHHACGVRGVHQLKDDEVAIFDSVIVYDDDDREDVKITVAITRNGNRDGVDLFKVEPISSPEHSGEKFWAFNQGWKSLQEQVANL